MSASKLKINYLPEFFSAIFGRKKPILVTVNLTERCNQRCIYCEIGNNSKAHIEDVLTKEDLFWIIDQMAKHKLYRLSLCGGEPFLFQGIIDVISYAWKNHIRCTITTNGMTVYMLNSSDLEILKKSETIINISVDSFQNSIQTLTRRSDFALQNALKSISVLNEEKIPVTILSAISKYNFDDLFSSLTKAYSYGIRQVLYQPIINCSNYPDKNAINNKSALNVSINDVEILMDQLSKICKFEEQHKINTNVYRILPWIKCYLKAVASANGSNFFNDVLKKFYCREVYAVIDISYDGGIQPCGLTFAAVNIKENKNADLLHLWSKAGDKLREDLSNNKYPLNCNGCCHKFSKNMFASIMKYPLSNRTALINIIPLVISRIFSRLFKSLFIKY
jgi:MoaA/NifB/PqqE/SkfB family radical SAM enzyme